LLEEFGSLGCAHKRAAQVQFVECESPGWEALNESEGIVTLDPEKHEPGCVAHELGHGFHECLLRDFPDWWLGAESESETVAETIRFFVELRMNSGTKKRWLPKAIDSSVIEACAYSLGGATGFCALLKKRWTLLELQEVKAALEDFKFSPEYKDIVKERERQDIEAIQRRLGRHVVVVYRKGGRIDRERRFDSESDCFEEVFAVESSIGLALTDTQIGPKLIGKGFIGLLPWEAQRSREGQGFTEAERWSFSCPIRVADVVENPQTDITTIYLESS